MNENTNGRKGGGREEKGRREIGGDEREGRSTESRREGTGKGAYLKTWKPKGRVFTHE